MAFKHHNSFATDLTANFGCYQSRIMIEIVSSVPQGFSVRYLNFCSMLIKQVVNLRKVRIENLKFMTDLLGHGCSVSNTLNIFFQYQNPSLHKKILLNKKLNFIQTMEVSTWPANIVFHLRQVWLQALVAMNSKSCLRSFPSYAHLHLK